VFGDGENSDSKLSPKLRHQEYDLSSESILQSDEFSTNENKLDGEEMKEKYMTSIRNAVYITNNSELIKIN